MNLISENPLNRVLWRKSSNYVLRENKYVLYIELNMYSTLLYFVQIVFFLNSRFTSPTKMCHSFYLLNDFMFHVSYMLLWHSWSIAFDSSVKVICHLCIRSILNPGRLKCYECRTITARRKKNTENRNKYKLFKSNTLNF